MDGLLWTARIRRRVEHQSIYRRHFFSYLWPPGVKDNIGNKKEKNGYEHLIEESNYKMSLQHAHRSGPWQAMLKPVKKYYDSWRANESISSSTPFRVLDLACGPRGEPGTTIARALPFATVHVTDASPEAVAAIAAVSDNEEASERTIQKNSVNSLDNDCWPVWQRRDPPPSNLTKSVEDLSDLSAYKTNSVNVIVCCYGYGLAPNVLAALTEAHRVLVPGGILVIATWQQSLLLSSTRDILAIVRAGGGTDVFNDGPDDDFFPPRISASLEPIALSGIGEFEALLVDAGFTCQDALVTSFGRYPFDLGNCTDLQFTMGTSILWSDLEDMGAFKRADESNIWKNLAEEAFWTTIGKYSDVVDGNLTLRDNSFKLTVSTKAGATV
jgi:SAM-dependent methyltransferase